MTTEKITSKEKFVTHDNKYGISNLAMEENVRKCERDEQCHHSSSGLLLPQTQM